MKVTPGGEVAGRQLGGRLGWDRSGDGDAGGGEEDGESGELHGAGWAEWLSWLWDASKLGVCLGSESCGCETVVCVAGDQNKSWV